MFPINVSAIYLISISYNSTPEKREKNYNKTTAETVLHLTFAFVINLFVLIKRYQ